MAKWPSFRFSSEFEKKSSDLVKITDNGLCYTAVTANHSVLHTDMKVKLLKKLREEAKYKYRLKKNVVNGVEQYSVVQVEYDAELSYEQRLFDSSRYGTAVDILEKYRSQYIRRRIEILRYGKTGIFLDV